MRHVANLQRILADSCCDRCGLRNLEQPPASTAVAVKRLVREEFLIEIDAVAVIPE